MVCQRCGNEITSTTTICPGCGTIIPPGKTLSSDKQQRNIQEAGPVETLIVRKSQADKTSSTPTVPPLPLERDEHLAFSSTTFTYTKEYIWLIELVFSLLGLFGVGWLLAGETLIGCILLISSVLIYWPVMLLGTFFTFGLGLLCLGPLALGAIMFNAFLFNLFLQKRFTQ